MKKTLLTLGIAIASFCSFAQQIGSSPIYYSGGNVGIGNTSPNTKIQVTAIPISSSDYYNSSIASFDTNTSDGLAIVRPGTGLIGFKTNNGRSLVFGNQSVGAGEFTEYLRISADGKVGIGTTNPLSKLQVGTLPSTSSSTPDALSLGGTYSSTHGINPKLKVYDNGIDFWGLGVSTSQLDYIVTGNAYDHVFYAGGGELMRIKGNGNVGIGTSNPEAPLTVYGKGLFFPNRIGSGDARSLQVDYQTTNPDFIDNNYPVVLKTGGGNQPLILDAARIGIGTSSPDEKLTVKGKIHAAEVKVEALSAIPDYVFEPEYKLSDLTELKTYLAKNHHLPEIQSAKEIEKNGISLGDMNMKLLKKVEELTLYLIEKDEKDKEKDAKIQLQQDQLIQQNKRIAALEAALAKRATNK